MANSEGVMTRLAKLEANVATMAHDVADLKAAAWRTTEILVDHSEHLSRLQLSMDGTQRSMDGCSARWMTGWAPSPIDSIA